MNSPDPDKPDIKDADKSAPDQVMSDQGESDAPQVEQTDDEREEVDKDEDIDEEDVELEMEEATQPTQMRTIEPAKGPGRFGRFMRSVFSHVAFAGLIFAGAGYFGYLNNNKIMRDVGDTVCSAKLLGGYMSKPGTSSTQASAPPATPAASSTPSQSSSTSGQNEAGKVNNAATAGSQDASGLNSKSLPSGGTPATIDIATLRRQSEQPAGAAPAAAATAPSTAPIAQPDAAAAKNKPVTADAKKSPATAGPSSSQPEAKADNMAVTNDQNAAQPQPETSQPNAAPSSSESQIALQTPPSTPASQPAQPNAAAAPVQPPQGQTAQDAAAQHSQAKPIQPIALADAWKLAREAYASGRPNSDETYKKLIRRFPDVPDLPGELGNIYYREGKLPQAAEQYYEAAMRLIQRNQPARAACLLGVLERIDPARAALLSRQTRQRCPTQR